MQDFANKDIIKENESEKIWRNVRYVAKCGYENRRSEKFCKNFDAFSPYFSKKNNFG